MRPNEDDQLASDAEARRLGADEPETVVPLFIEEVALSKRLVETGRVRISTTTRQEEQVLDEVLKQEDIQVERRAIGRPIESVPGMREEGDTIIVPVVEEVVVVERRLILKEEIHIKRVRGTKRYQERVVLRRQEAVIERIPAGTFHSGSGEVSDAETQLRDNRVEVKKES